MKSDLESLNNSKMDFQVIDKETTQSQNAKTNSKYGAQQDIKESEPKDIKNDLNKKTQI